MKKKQTKQKRKSDELSENNLSSKIVTSKKVRQVLTRASPYWFFHVFFSHYIQYETAPFQIEMLKLCEEEHKFLAIMAFRESGKSTIMTLAYPLWAILGKPQKKCVVIISKTQDQAKALFLNIRRELESNILLKNDLGPFRGDDDPWKLLSLNLTQFNARIFAISRGQSIRGIRHGIIRPDLIIIDDIEDTNDTGTEQNFNSWGEEKESELDRWFTNEVLPAANNNARIVVLGNLLSPDCFLMRIKRGIDSGKINGIFRAYPFLDDEGKILWPSRFPTMRSINELKKRFQKEETWNREYLLLYDDYGGGLRFIAEENEKILEQIDPSMTPKIGVGVNSMDEYSISAPRPVITATAIEIKCALDKGYYPEKKSPRLFNSPLLLTDTEDEPYIRLPRFETDWEINIKRSLEIAYKKPLRESG